MAKNFYIQGDAARADKIKAAFEKLGYDTSRHLFNADSVLYFTFNDEISATTNELFKTFIKSCPDYQELKLPVQPKFKVGDEIFRPARNEYFKIRGIEKDNGTVWYVTARTRIADNDKRMSEIVRINAFYQNEYSIAPKPHYDIANFHAGMPVLVRWYNTGRWRYSLYSFYEEDSINPFDTVKGSFTQCIPFNDDTKHLLGTTDMCDEKYINW